MNILPKKKWHVRTWDNIQRVKRDEAKAAEEEKQQKAKVALAEQEFRTRLLREKAEQRKTKLNFDTPVPAAADSETIGAANDAIVQDATGHVNFFAELEAQEKTIGGNKDYEREKKEERETHERKIGLLKYLGEGSQEYMKEPPWWLRVPSRSTATSEMSSESKLQTKDTSACKLSQTVFKNSPSSSGAKVLKDDKPRLVARRDKRSHEGKSCKRTHKSRKHKKKSKKRRRRSSSFSSTDSGKSNCERSSGQVKKESSSMAQLRAERLKREQEERLKAERLLRSIRGEKEPTEAAARPKIQQKYNSQFNPDFARQNRPS